MKYKFFTFLLTLVFNNLIFGQNSISDFKIDLKSFDKVIDKGISNDQLYELLKDYVVNWEEQKFAEFNELTGEHDLIVSSPKIVLEYNGSRINIEPKSLEKDNKIYSITVGFRCTCDWFAFNPKELSYQQTENSDNPDYRNSLMGGIQKKFRKGNKMLFYHKYHSRPYFEFSITKDKPKPKEPTKSEEFVSSTLVKIKSSDWMKAMEYANKAVESDKNNPNAYFVRGLVRHLNLGENLIFEKGSQTWTIMEDYNKAISINNETDIFFEQRAKLYEKLDSTKNAITDYKKALEINPNNKVVRMNLIDIQIENNQDNEAISNIQFLIDNGIQDPEIFIQSALIKWKKGRKDDACIDFKKAKTLGLNMSGRLDLLEMAQRCN